MSVTSNYNEQEKQLHISISGEFDYTLHRELRDAYKDSPSGVKYMLDLSKTEHLDSSALGMLLLMRDHAGGDKAEIVIRGCRPNIKKIFEIAHFDRLFTIV